MLQSQPETVEESERGTLVNLNSVPNSFVRQMNQTRRKDKLLKPFSSDNRKLREHNQRNLKKVLRETLIGCRLIADI